MLNIYKIFFSIGLALLALPSFAAGLKSLENTYELHSLVDGEYVQNEAFITVKAIDDRHISVHYHGNWNLKVRGLTQNALCQFKKKGKKFQCRLDNEIGLEFRKDKNIYQYNWYRTSPSIFYVETRYYAPIENTDISSPWVFEYLDGSTLTASTKNKETSLAIYCDTDTPLLRLKFEVSNLLYRAASFASNSADYSLFIKSSIGDDEFNFSEWEVYEDNVILRNSPVNLIEELRFRKGHKVSFDFLLKNETTGDLEPLTQIDFSLAGSNVSIDKVVSHCKGELNSPH